MDHAANPAPRGLTASAAAFEFVVVWAAIAAGIFAGWPHGVTQAEWTTFAVLAPLIAAVHLLGSDRDKHQGSHLSLAPMFAAVLLLPLVLAAAAIAIAFVPEWFRTRVAWYIVVFNVANFVGPALVAGAAFDLAVASGTPVSWSIGALVSVAVFLCVQYAVLTVMLRLARDVRPADTVRLDCVLIDAGLLALGAIAVGLWERSPALVPLAVLLLAVLYRSLSKPSLVEASRIEPKTGLFNMRHFQAALDQELARASRFERPLGLFMIDVDHLRQINNVHGHVGGDRALSLVAGNLREATRDYDVAARFGGDEFCVLLPETGVEAALAVAERIRGGVERAGEAAGFGTTVSVGVAAVTGGTFTGDELLALADRAAYRAKYSGRNTVALPPEGDPVDEAERLLRDAARVA